MHLLTEEVTLQVISVVEKTHDSLCWYSKGFKKVYTPTSTKTYLTLNINLKYLYNAQKCVFL